MQIGIEKWVHNRARNVGTHEAIHRQKRAKRVPESVEVVPVMRRAPFRILMRLIHRHQEDAIPSTSGWIEWKRKQNKQTEKRK
jgi:hypothetical protein